MVRSGQGVTSEEYEFRFTAFRILNDMPPWASARITDN